MTLLELEARKAQLVRSVLNDIHDEETLNELSVALDRLTGKIPCRYSVEEIRTGADRFLEALHNGDESKFISHEEVLKKHNVL